MNIFEKYNELSEGTVADDAGLSKKERSSKYECPCGRGDGIKQQELKGKLIWHCYSVYHEDNQHMSNSDLLAKAKGITDKAELAKAIEELHPDLKDTNSFFLKVDSSSATKDYSTLYSKCRAKLPGFVESQGGAWRGLTYGTLFDAGGGYNEAYDSVILPYDERTYFFRNLKPIDGKIVKGINKGGKRRLYYPPNSKFKTGKGTLNFLTEGEIDALSAYQALKPYLEQFGIAATGSVQFVHKTIEELNKTYGDCLTKPRFIWLGDNDAKEEVRKATEDFVEALNAAGYPTIAVFFSNDTGRKVDANQYLQEHGDSGLAGFLFDVVDSKEGDLDKLARDIMKAAVQAQGIKSSSLSDYLEEDFDADVAHMSKHSDRATGFENLDVEQLFLPGLYVVGGTPGTGKTTFCWQLLSQLAGGDEYQGRSKEYCVFCCYEMSRMEMAAKSIARDMRRQWFSNKEISCLSSSQIRLGAGKFNDAAKAAMKRLKATMETLNVMELSNTNLTELLVALNFEAQRAKEAGLPLVICVDYLQLIPVENSKATAKERIDEAMLRLKNFQRETNSTLIVISSLNREACNVGGTKLFAFKESGSVEYSSDVAWLLVREDEEDSPRHVKLVCMKNRSGATYEVSFEYWAQSDYFCGRDRSSLSEEEPRKKKKVRDS